MSLKLIVLVIDGTPRDCAQNSCGSQADTAIIRTREIQSGKASALGRTQGGGPVDASKMVSLFMGGDANATDVKQAREIHAAQWAKRSLQVRQRNGGQKTPAGTKETGVKAAAGGGASAGQLILSTCV